MSLFEKLQEAIKEVNCDKFYNTANLLLKQGNLTELRAFTAGAFVFCTDHNKDKLGIILNIL